jgi:hypothetical protein
VTEENWIDKFLTFQFTFHKRDPALKRKLIYTQNKLICWFFQLTMPVTQKERKTPGHLHFPYGLFQMASSFYQQQKAFLN